MENFIADKRNQELLIQQGVLIPRETPKHTKHTNKAEKASDSAQETKAKA